MRTLIAADSRALTLAVGLALLAAACATSPSELVTESETPQVSFVASIEADPQDQECPPDQRPPDKAVRSEARPQRSFEAFVADLSPAKREALVGALWDIQRRSGADSRISGVLRRTLGYLLRDRLCDGHD